MKICPKYFTDVTSKLSTTDDIYVEPARRNAKGWCKIGAKFKDFSVGGLTLLHEMTHLDAVGKLAEYPQVTDVGGIVSHGTEDVGGIAPANNPPLQARNLLKLWTSGKATKATLVPYRNAESIAASAFGEHNYSKLGLMRTISN